MLNANVAQFNISPTSHGIIDWRLHVHIVVCISLEGFPARHAIVAISDIEEHFGDFMIGRSAPEKGILTKIGPETETRFPNRQHSNLERY